jgi:hypothetical protein
LRVDSRYGVEGGFPHSEILGSKLVRSSPRLIAAYHVLHRLSAPRHPPDALKALDHSHDRCPPPDPGRTCSREPRDAQKIRKTMSSDFSEEHFACRTHLRRERGHALAGRQALGGPTIRCIPSLRFQTSAKQPKPPCESSLTPDTYIPARLLVEPDGIEPTTSCLQSTRSPN